MNFFKKLLVRGTALGVTLLYSVGAFAQSYIMKTAFVGEPGLKNLIIGKIFDENHKVFEDSTNTCGFRLPTSQDAVLYRFRDISLSSSGSAAMLSACDIVFMIVDFSSPTADLDNILTKRFREIRAASGGRKIILIAMNTNFLPESDLARFNDARTAYGKNNFDYILTSLDEDDETFRNKFFDATDRMIDWRRLPSSVESGERIIHRLIWLRALVSKEFDKDALIRELIRQDNARIAVEQRTETFGQDMSATKEKLEDLGHRTEDLEKVAKELKITVEELNNIRDLASRLNGLTQALGELSTLLQGISAGRPFNAAEAQHICNRIEANLKNFDTDAKDSSTDREDPKDEMKKLRNHIRELRQIVAENVEDLNALKQSEEAFKDCLRKVKASNDSLIEDRTAWLQKATQIQHYVDQLKKDEEYIKTICEGKIKEFDWEQYNKCGWFGKWITRTIRPYINDREKRKKLLEKQNEVAEELKKLDEGEKSKTPERGSDEGENREKPEKKSDESEKPKKAETT